MGLSDLTWRVRTLDERPDLEGAVRSMGADVLPEFMHHDAAVNRVWGELFDRFAGFQVAVCDEGDRVVAAGNSVPLFWDGSLEGLPGGVGEAIERGVGDLGAGRAPTVASALLATVAPGFQGRGLSGVVLRAMKDVAAGRGLAALIAPVRPTLKDRYPLTPMERYARWQREDGLPLDPWLRVHRRLGAGFLRVAPAVHDGHGHRGGVGGLDGDALPGERSLRRAGCPLPGADGPGAGPRYLRGAERLDAPPHRGRGLPRPSTTRRAIRCGSRPAYSYLDLSVGLPGPYRRATGRLLAPEPAMVRVHPPSGRKVSRRRHWEQGRPGNL